MGKMTKKSLVIVAAALITAVAGQAQAETRFAVQDAAGAVDRMVVTDEGRIGIGVPEPTTAMQVRGGTMNASTIDLGYSGNATYNKFYAPTLQFVRNNLPTDANGIPKTTDRLGFINFGSVISGQFRQAAQMNAVAEGPSWSATNYPAAFTFSTTPPNAQYAVERIRVASTGNVGIGVSAPAQRLEVNGGVRLNPDATTARPTCSTTIRGTIWVTQGATGFADTVDVCAKDSAGNYAWRTL